jgi:hypothetical protein
VGRVDEGEPGHQHRRRQHEEHTRDDPAGRAVQKPAHVRRQLLSLGAGQQHAERQRVQEPVFVDPAPPFDQLVVHDRDLPARPTEVDEPEPQPEPERLAEGGFGRSVHRDPAGAGRSMPARIGGGSGCGGSRVAAHR